MLALLLTLATFTFCGHGHCTKPHRVYERTCRGVLFLAPRPIHTCNPAEIPSF